MVREWVVLSTLMAHRDMPTYLAQAREGLWKAGKVEAFIVGVGGFLGIGSKDVTILPSLFTVVDGDKFKNKSDKLKLSMTKHQLKQAANFDPYNPPRATTGLATGSSSMSRPAPAPTAQVAR